MPANNSECSCPRSHKNSQTSPKITALAKSPSMHPLQNCISYLQYSSNLSTLLYMPITYHPTARVYSLITVSFSIEFCNRSIAYATPALWNGLPKDLRQLAHPPNPPPNLTYPPLALSSAGPATFHSRLKTELFKLSYPDSTPGPRHVRHHHRLQP